jgi:hypothetical protein
VSGSNLQTIFSCLIISPSSSGCAVYAIASSYEGDVCNLFRNAIMSRVFTIKYGATALCVEQLSLVDVNPKVYAHIIAVKLPALLIFMPINSIFIVLMPY